MEVINEFFQHYSIEILAASFLLAFLSFLIAVINYIRTKRIIKKYKKLMRGTDNKNLESMLINHINIVHEVESKLDEINRNYTEICKKLSNCIQKVGIVRYNPFEQMGSDQSFSIALLDEHNDGIVLTGLFTRSNSSLYAKPIHSMESSYPLSDEEKNAIKIAVNPQNKINK